MSMSQKEQKKAVEAGYWLLYRYNPLNKLEGKNPLTLDSKAPITEVSNFLEGEKRYTVLNQTFPAKVEGFRIEMQKYITERYEHYKKLSE